MAKRGGGMKRHSRVVWPGFSSSPAPRNIKKIGRNELCPCESGKKYKDQHVSICVRLAVAVRGI